MSALGPKARALLDSGRSALRPAAGERERVEEALRARLGAAVLPPQGSVAPPPPAAATAFAGWQAGIGAAIGAGLIGAALYLGVSSRAEAPARPTPPEVHAPSAPARVEGEAPSVSGVETPVEAVTPSSPVAVPAVRAAPSARTQDKLSEEVALLSRATAALRDGRAAEALKALDEHQQRFPRGALGEERRAAKAQALCSLGRVTEGRAVLGLLAPRSPAAARAKQVCAAGSVSRE